MVGRATDDSDARIDTETQSAIDASTTTRVEFQRLLCDVLRAAERNGVDVEGGHEVSPTVETRAWDVVITEVQS